MDNTGTAERDRLSGLPDALIHQISSSLDMIEVVHTCVLSNRWRYIWLSTPYLDFDLDYWLRNCSILSYTRKRNDFIDFVDNVLVYRGSSDSIFKFKFNVCDRGFDFDLLRVSSWIRQCLGRDVRHLFICIPFVRVEHENLELASILPRNLFDSNISELVLSFCWQSPVPLPNIRRDSMIKKLQLYGVRLPDGNAEGEFILSCNVLEDLKISQCDIHHLKTLTVSTPLLRKLWLQLYTVRDTDCKVKVNIHTPQLNSLNLTTYSGQQYSPVYYSIEDDLLSLASAYVYISTGEHFDLLDACSESMLKILSKVYDAQTLKLLICTKKVLLDFPVLLDGLTHQFQNLRCLKLMDRMQVPQIQAIVNFLLCFPRIDTLIWERTWRGWDGEDSEEEELVADGPENLVKLVADEPENLVLNLPLESLKILEIHNLQGVGTELEFLSVLLEKAILLDQLIISCNGLLLGEKLARFQEMVLSLPRASSHVSVSFLDIYRNF